MNKYEALLEEAYNDGLTVKEKVLLSSNGRICGNRIAIRQDIGTTKEKACVLAEELGHHYTTIGNIVNLDTPSKRKQERQARMWAYNKQIGLDGLLSAFKAGCRSQYEIAEYLEVTEEDLQNCVECYKDKYGVCVEIKNYIIYFIPHLAVLKMI